MKKIEMNFITLFYLASLFVGDAAFGMSYDSRYIIHSCLKGKTSDFKTGGVYQSPFAGGSKYCSFNINVKRFGEVYLLMDDVKIHELNDEYPLRLRRRFRDFINKKKVFVQIESKTECDKIEKMLNQLEWNLGGLGKYNYAKSSSCNFNIKPIYPTITKEEEKQVLAYIPPARRSKVSKTNLRGIFYGRDIHQQCNLKNTERDSSKSKEVETIFYSLSEKSFKKYKYNLNIKSTEEGEVLCVNLEELKKIQKEKLFIRDDIQFPVNLINTNVVKAVKEKIILGKDMLSSDLIKYSLNGKSTSLKINYLKSKKNVKAQLSVINQKKNYKLGKPIELKLKFLNQSSKKSIFGYYAKNFRWHGSPVPFARAPNRGYTAYWSVTPIMVSDLNGDGQLDFRIVIQSALRNGKDLIYLSGKKGYTEHVVQNSTYNEF